MTGFEPVLTEAVVSPIIKAAIEAAATRLKKASEDHSHDAKQAIILLETANGLMGALEAETDQILLSAMVLPNAADPQSRNALVVRLNALLYGEVMRPTLAHVHAQLQVLHEELAKDSKRFFGRVPPSEDVAATLTGLGEVIDYIEQYRTWLDLQASGTFASAPFGPELIEIQRMLMAGADDSMIAEQAKQTIAGRPPIGIVRNEHMGKVVEQLRTRIR